MKSPADLYRILSADSPKVLEGLLQEAERIRLRKVGNRVYLRALIEFSNYCERNCLYCGLRKANSRVKRYRLNHESIVALAMQAYQQGFYSIALQSGEVDNTVDFIAKVIEAIKEASCRDGGPGLGITLSIGELSYQQYQKLYAAGAHRYLLRIETSNPKLFRSIHPPAQLYEKRIECLKALKNIGYQVGTGVMVGIPGQTYEDLTRDLCFFMEKDIDMLGLGPYLPHSHTPLGRMTNATVDPYKGTLKMLALARILMPDINIVASTALQSIHPDGLKNGIRAGANVVMPVITPENQRKDYYIYDNKKYRPFENMLQEINDEGYQVEFRAWGDPRHYYKRLGIACPEK